MTDKSVLELRKKIFNNLKKKAYGYEQLVSSQLKQYLRQQTRMSQRPNRPTNYKSLVERMLKSDIIYLGDFHTFDQNVRNVVRMLKLAAQDSRPCYLALEMVDFEHQLYIEAFQERHITELEFLESIDYRQSWRFPWTHYKVIFELAAQYGIKIFGINTRGTLDQRDQFAAEACCELMQQNPEARILVLYGELHILPDKIPALVKKIRPQVTSLIIHQNLDQVYWEQIQKGKLHPVVKFTAEEYCLNTAPPWAKYESMVYWYENLCQDPEFDIHNYVIENGRKIFNEDTQEDFLQLSLQVTKAVDWQLDTWELEDFHLYDHTHLDRVESRIMHYDHPALIHYYLYLVETGQSFRFPDCNYYYCSNYSLNRMAYLVGVELYHYQLQLNDIEALPILMQGNQLQKYIYLVFQATMGFFFSKIINPYRKCDMYHNLAQQAQNLKLSKDQLQVLKLTLHTLDQKSLKEILKGKRLPLLHQAANMVGHILGEYLYLEVIENDRKELLPQFLSTMQIDQQCLQELMELLVDQSSFRSHSKRFF